MIKNQGWIKVNSSLVIPGFSAVNFWPPITRQPGQTDWIHIDTCWQLQSLIARYHERQNKVLATHLLTEERPAGRCLPKRPIIPSRALFNAPGAPVHANSCWFHGGLSYGLRCGSLPNYTNLACQPIRMWPLQFRIVEGDGHIIFSLE